MIKFVAALAFVVFATMAQAEPLVLAKTYDCVGANPDGSKYTGTVSVNVLSDTTFAIRWDINGATYKGFGMRRNNAVAATYMIDGEPGLIIYEVQGNGLDGLWAVKGEPGNGSEHLTPRN